MDSMWWRFAVTVEWKLLSKEGDVVGEARLQKWDAQQSKTLVPSQVLPVEISWVAGTAWWPFFCQMMWKSLQESVLWRSKEEKKPSHSSLIEGTRIFLSGICSGCTKCDLGSWVCLKLSTVCRPVEQHVVPGILIPPLFICGENFFGGIELVVVSSINDWWLLGRAETLLSWTPYLT